MAEFFARNIVVVYFFYGLAFFSMGLAIWLASARFRTSEFRLAGALLFLAGFGVVHGLQEWHDMFVHIDPIVIRDNWTGAYHFVAGPAIGQLNSYAKANDPFANAGTQAINVEIVSVLARSPSTYQVQWRETQFNAGTSGVTENWTGLFTAKINPPKNEAELRANPLGIFITAFQWSREL